MSSYTLSGSGVQALGAGVTAFHVTISTPPINPGSGAANPLDYYGIGFLRPGDASAFWDPFAISGGPQWLPCPFGATRVGYSLLNGAVVTLVEVFGPSPLAVPLAQLPDVALSSPADTQVLTYQASSSKWINAAAPTGGGGGGGDWVLISAGTLSVTSNSVIFASLPTTTRKHLRLLWHARVDSAASAVMRMRLNGDTGANYSHTHSFIQNSTIVAGGATGETSLYLAGIPGTGSGGFPRAAAGETSIIDFPNATFWKQVTTIETDGETTPPWGSSAHAEWLNTAAITSLLLFPDAGVFSVGCQFSLYGLT